MQTFLLHVAYYIIFGIIQLVITFEGLYSQFSYELEEIIVAYTPNATRIRSGEKFLHFVSMKLFAPLTKDTLKLLNLNDL